MVKTVHLASILRVDPYYNLLMYMSIRVGITSSKVHAFFKIEVGRAHAHLSLEFSTLTPIVPWLSADSLILVFGQEVGC